MNWKYLESLSDWEQAKETSNHQPVLVFKHSTRCGVSRFVLKNVEGDMSTLEGKNIACYFLDLLAHRDISAAIAHDTGIEHQSPQMIVLKNRKPVFNASHYEIDLNTVARLE